MNKVEILREDFQMAPPQPFGSTLDVMLYFFTIYHRWVDDERPNEQELREGTEMYNLQIQNAKY